MSTQRHSRHLQTAIASALFVLGPAFADTPSIRPQDNFYKYVNQQWMDHTSIPAEVPWTSPYVDNVLTIQKRLQTVIEDAAGNLTSKNPDQQSLGALYRAYLVGGLTDKAAGSLLSSPFSRINGLQRNTLAMVLIDLSREDTDTDLDSHTPQVIPLSVIVRPDNRQPTVNALVIEPGSLGLPGRGYYLVSEPATDKTLIAYRSYIIHLFGLAQLPNGEQAAEQVIEIETILAKAQRPAEQLHDGNATYNRYDLATLQETFPGFDWQDFLHQINPSVSSVIVSEPAYTAAFTQLASKLPEEAWKNYLRWQVLRRYARVLPQGFRDADEDFYGRVLMGNERARAHGETAALVVAGLLPEALGHLYVARYVTPDTKAQVTEIADSIRSTFARRIASSKWLESETKAAALEKLRKLTVKIGYPDTPDEGPLDTMSDSDAIADAERISRYRFDRKVAQIGETVDRSRWLEEPQSTNVFYSRSTNELTVMAGALIPPLFELACRSDCELCGDWDEDRA